MATTNEGASAFDPATETRSGPLEERREPLRHESAVEVEQRVITKPARTSAAAAFALILGVAALLLPLAAGRVI